MEEYDQREIVDLAVAAANSLTPSSPSMITSSLITITTTKDNNEHLLTMMTQQQEQKMTCPSSNHYLSFTTLKVTRNNDEYRIQTNTSSPYQNIVCYKQPTQPTESSCVLPRILNSVRLLVLTYWMDKILRHVIVPR